MTAVTILTQKLVNMAFDIKQAWRLACLTILTMSVIPWLKFESQEEIPRYCMEAGQSLVLEHHKPAMESFCGDWIVGLLFYYAVVALIMAMPKDHFYKFPEFNFRWHVEDNSNQKLTKHALTQHGVGSFLLAHCIIHLLGIHKASVVWLTLVSLALQTDLLKSVPNVEGNYIYFLTDSYTHSAWAIFIAKQS